MTIRRILPRPRRFPVLAPAAALALMCGAWAAPVLAGGQAAEVAQWLRKLDDASYRVREEAQQRLIALGEPAEQAVAEALKSGSPEVRARARVILAEIQRRTQQARTDAVRKRVVWSRPIEGGVAGAAVVSDGVAVVVGGAQKLHGIDVKTGREVWVSEQAGLLGQLQADAGKIFAIAGSGGRTLVAFDPGKGTVAWRSDVPGDQPVHLTAVGGVVYAGGSRLMALEAATGKTRWEAPLPAPVSAPAVVAGGAVFVARADGKVRALDLATGKALWEIEVFPAAAVAALAADDGVLCAMGASAVVALDVKERKELWRFPLPGPARQVGAAIQINGRNLRLSGSGGSLRMARGLVFVRSGAAVSVHALAGRTGEKQWTYTPRPPDGAAVAGPDGIAFPAGGGVQIVGAQGARIQAGRLILSGGWGAGTAAPLTVAGPVVYCPASDALRAVDAGTGRELWQLPTTGQATTPVLAGGLLLLGTRQGTVFSPVVPGGGVFVGGRPVPGRVRKEVDTNGRTARSAPGLFAERLPPAKGR